MKARLIQFTVTFGPRDTGPFLDMLRYEGARVISWGHADDLRRSGDSYFTVTLESERFTPDRWASFGLRVKEA